MTGELGKILAKPDNLPIVLMMAMFGLLFGWWWRTARRNDRLLAEGGEARLKEHMDGPPVAERPEDNLPKAMLHTWPYLLRIELLGAMAVLAFLGVWAIAIDAPLEQLADPGRTPNPSKAPWYFLGLQELLVYFDPWIAGVTLPLLIIVGLCAIPYLDVNPAGSGYYSFRGRKLALSTFLFGFFGLWLPLIVVGTFFRGPGWAWFWPWEEWVVSGVDHPTRNLPALFGVHSPGLAAAFGAAVLLAWFGGGFALAFSRRARATATFQRMGAVRVAAATFLALAMLGLPVKIALRLLFDVKYVLVSSWFNV